MLLGALRKGPCPEGLSAVTYMSQAQQECGTQLRSQTRQVALPHSSPGGLVPLRTQPGFS